jgi:signal transduction histidine kinase
VSKNAGGLRAQDLLLTLLFLAMAAATPERDPSQIILILLLGALQITESRFAPLDTPRGKVLWNLGKVVVAYLLIGITGGVQSGFYLMLLFPVISAAATLSVFSTLAFTALSCAAYLSFLMPPFIDWTRVDIHEEAIDELARRVLILGISGLLVNTLAVALREQARRYQALAEQLGETNRSLRAAEAQVRRGERLAALGQLTAGLAHELRNPLGTIKGSADMLNDNLPAGDEIARELAGYISSEVDRTNSLVSRFLDFARPLELRLAPAALGEVVQRAVMGARRDAETHRVSLHVNPPKDEITFDFDAELMERVFLNLMVNAIQASSPGSEVTVQWNVDGDGALIAIADRGTGIPAEKMESIFNPFFTTKSTGTGLGLAIVAKIVDEHHGKITVDSEPGEGSTFTVRLPMASVV